MPEHSGHRSEDLLNNIRETFADSVQKKKSVSFYGEDESVSVKINKVFGRQNSVHDLLGGGKCKLFLILTPLVLSTYTADSIPLFWVQLLMCCCGGIRRSLQVSWQVQRRSGSSSNGLITIL